MRHWQQLSDEDRRSVLEITAAKTGLPQLAVEKDWWVTMKLKALTMTRHFHLMSFKGGTSLSKGWHLINRFSEDIDISMRRDDAFSISSASGNQLAKVRRAARHYIVRELPEELEEIMMGMGLREFSIEPETVRADAMGNLKELSATTHPSTVFIHYKSLLRETAEYIQPKVKIEISCLSMDDPVEVRSLHSMLSEILKEEEDVEVLFPTVVPTRTFLEKIFLLHEEFQKGMPRCRRMSRHLYDIEKIMDTHFGNAIFDRQLYDCVVSHRSIFNKIAGIDYSLHAPATLSFVPPAALRPEWEADYQSMRRDFIFERESLTYSQLIERMKELQRRIRSLS